MKTLIITLIVCVVVIILLAIWLMCWLTNNLFPRFTNGESIYNSEYQYSSGFAYTGEKKSLDGNVIAVIKGQLIDINEELDRAILRDNKEQHHAVSLETLKEA